MNVTIRVELMTSGDLIASKPGNTAAITAQDAQRQRVKALSSPMDVATLSASFNLQSFSASQSWNLQITVQVPFTGLGQKYRDIIIVHWRNKAMQQVDLAIILRFLFITEGISGGVASLS